MTKFQKKLWVGLVIMALVSPLGIYLPKKFNAEDAWGEWGTDKLEKLLGYVPEGMKKIADLWKAPIQDYNFGRENAAMSTQVMSYIASGIVGILLAAIAVYVISKTLVRRSKQ